MKCDVIAIRNEYIHGNSSYRDLAKKYGVSYQRICQIGKAEGWVEKRKKQHDKIGAKVEQKTAEKLAEKEANRLLRISNAADKLLEKIEIATEQLDQFITTNKVKQKEVKYVTDKAGFGKPAKEVIKEIEDKRIVKADHLDRIGLKQLASALKDLKEIQFTQNEEKQEGNQTITFVEDLEPDE